MATRAAAPIGGQDGTTCSSGAITTSGWAFDYDIPWTPLTVYFYTDDDKKYVGSCVADDFSQGVWNYLLVIYGLNISDRAFNCSFNKYADGDTISGSHTIYSYVTDDNVGGGGILLPLENAPPVVRDFTCPPPCTAIITANPPYLSYSSDVSTVSWSTTNATSCWGWRNKPTDPPEVTDTTFLLGWNGGAEGWVNPSGSGSTGALRKDQRYNIECYGSGNECSSSVTVPVYSCSGSVPSGSIKCSNDDTGLTGNLLWQGNVCTPGRKCEYTTCPACNWTNPNCNDGLEGVHTGICVSSEATCDCLGSRDCTGSRPTRNCSKPKNWIEVLPK
jgi:hypothetical protein